jgi:hypothetical protein
MDDSLSEFVKKNKDGFDDKEPSARVWKEIENRLPLAKHVSIWNSVAVWRAAALAFLCLSLYTFFTRPNGRPNMNAYQSADFRDLEIFYSGQIQEKVEFINSFETGNEKDQLGQDFQKLDAMYQVLSEEMKIRPSEKVKDAMVLNLLIRIDLLNQQIKKLEDKRKPRNMAS